MHRVQKLLSNYGYCSRDKAEILIKQGRVKVNNKTITIGDKASEDDKISVDNKPVKKQKRVYLMFNKPIGCVTALTDKFYKTIFHYVKIKERVFPVGRLDYNTSGLLILTNDGDFSNKIQHPRYEIKKTYQVELYNEITEQHIMQIEKGIKLEDGKTQPAKVKLLNKNSMNITIHEGKNRIIRRMMKAIDLKLKTLTRIKIGNLKLNNLQPGKFKHLTEEQKQLIFK